MDPIDFQRIAADLLASARDLLPQWLPGGRFVGSEFKAGNLSGDRGDSLSVNLNTGAWADFATDDQRGGDLLSLFAAIHGIKQSEAARRLTGMPDPAPRRPNGNGGAGHPVPAPVPSLIRPPPGAKLPDCRHARHGAPAHVYPYNDPDGLLYVIARYEPAGGRKQFCPWTWDGSNWQPKAPPEPRALFGLVDLAARPDAKVLMVEGEKAAQAAARLLPAYVVMTWAGGAASVSKADLQPLAGRAVDIWPDADAAGVKAGATLAAKLLDIGCDVRIINPTDVAEGWDAADAEAAGWDRARIIEWARPRMKSAEDGLPPAAPRRRSPADRAPTPPIVAATVHVEQPVDPGSAPSAFMMWRQAGLDCNSSGIPYPHESNLRAILTSHPQWAGRVYFDSFRQRIIYAEPGRAPREWRDSDDVDLTIWLQSVMRMPKVNVTTVARAIESAARAGARNPLHEYLGALEWDGTPRLEDWLGDVLAVRKTAYSAAVGRNWLVSMIARAYRPGCQVDTMPVLEGKQGKGKSSTLEVLGGEFYASTTDPFGGKDFLQSIIGVWLVEIPDLAGFSKRDHSHIIATVTQRTDRYRQSYGRRAGDYPRTCVLAATAETDDYLADSRGIRRFWPVRCGETGDFNLDYLRSNRDHLFAEALHLYRQGGAEWWVVPEKEAREEQQTRRDSDPWSERVLRYAELHPEGIEGGDVLTHCLEIPIGMQDTLAKRRVGLILRTAGYVRVVSKRPDRSSIIRWKRI